MSPYICSIGGHDLRRTTPKYSGSSPNAQVHDLEAILPQAVPHDNDSLKKYRNSKHFLIRYRLPAGTSLQLIHDVLTKQTGGDVCVGSVNSDAEDSLDIFAYIHKEHTRYFKPHAFNVGGHEPLALYNFAGRRLYNVIGLFARVVNNTYSGIEMHPPTSITTPGFEAINAATKTLTHEQFLTLKGKCLSVESKKRTQFETTFLRVCCALSDLRREGLMLI